MPIVRLNGSNLGLIKDEVKDGEGYSTPVADEKILKNMEVSEHQSSERAKVAKAMKMPITEPKPPQLTGDEDDIQKMADSVGKTGTTTVKRTEEKKEESKPADNEKPKEGIEQKVKKLDDLVQTAAKTLVDELTKPSDGESADKAPEDDFQPSEGVYHLIDSMIESFKRKNIDGEYDYELFGIINGIDDKTLRDCMYICVNGDFIAKLLLLEYQYYNQDTSSKLPRPERIYREAIVKYYDLGALSVKEMDVAINTVMKVLAKGLR